jgi:tetratricopeptide (TPR) repeat protein
MKYISHPTALLCAALVLGVSATNAAAQQQRRTLSPEFVFPDGYVLSTPVETHLDKGDQLLGQQQFGKARAEFKAALELIREDGGYPGIAMRRIADSYYHEGRYQKAISMLDRLAEEAAIAGDVVTQAWAVADAAWVMMKDAQREGKRARTGATMEVKQRLERLNRLLQSRYLPQDVRAQIIARRCNGDCSPN